MRCAGLPNPASVSPLPPCFYLFASWPSEPGGTGHTAGSSIPLVQVNALRKGSPRDAWPPAQRREVRQGRKLRRRELRARNKRGKGAPVHALGPEGREIAVEAEDVLVGEPLDLPGGQEGDGALRLAVARLAVLVRGARLGPGGSLAQPLLQVARRA